MIGHFFARLFGFFVVVSAVALLGSTYVSPWAIHVALISVLIYMGGALMSAWTFLGYPASIGGGFR